MVQRLEFFFFKGSVYFLCLDLVNRWQVGLGIVFDLIHSLLLFRF